MPGGPADNIEGTIHVDNFDFTPIGPHIDGVSISGVVTLTPPIGATKLLIQALTQNVRFTLSGHNPTATKGFQLVAGDPPTVIPIATEMEIRVVEETATADLQYQWGF